MKRRLHQLNDELWNSDRNILFLEEIHQTLPPILDRWRIPMRCQFLLDLLCLPFLLRYIQLQKLNIMRSRTPLPTFLTIIIERKRRLNGRINKMMCLNHLLLVESIPLVNSLILNWRIQWKEDSLIVDEIHKMKDNVKWIFSSIPQQRRKFFV